MLERRHRLTSTTDFATATRRGRRAGSRTLVIHLDVREPGPDAGQDSGPASASRVGFAVGRGVGNAVTRNRVKRRLRHLARERVARLPESVHLVVRALPAAADASYAALGRDLDQALGRLGVRVGVSERAR